MQRALRSSSLSAHVSLSVQLFSQHFQERDPANQKDISWFFFPEGADAQFDIGEMGFGFPFRVLVRRNQGGGLPWLQKLPQGLPGFLLYKAWK